MGKGVPSAGVSGYSSLVLTSSLPGRLGWANSMSKYAKSVNVYVVFCIKTNLYFDS
jgi:hypothetical protein